MATQRRQRLLIASVMVLASATTIPGAIANDGSTNSWDASEPVGAPNCVSECCDDDACCGCSPMTLFQWSYGTSFGGGAPLDEPLVTDRPDFTEASTTVGRGVSQIEIGYTYFSDDEGGDSFRGRSYPQFLLRQGVFAEWLEFRLGWTYLDERTVTGGVRSRDRGAADLYMGFKIALTPQEGILPEMALIPQVNLPTGADAFSADEIQPGLNWIYAWELSDSVSIAGSTQVNSVLDGVTADAYMSFAQSAVVGISLTEKVGTYAEWFAFMPHSADTDKPEHYFDGGFTYLVNDNCQLDVNAGVGLNRAAADWFLGTGVVVRF